jgi:drug/metabolite transporter (DMT)-like permease
MLQKGAERNTGLVDWCLLIVTAVAWGSMFIIVKKALAHISTPQLMGMRFLAMFVLTLPFLPTLLKQFRTPGLWTSEAKQGMLWLPFLGTLLPVFVITLAQTSVGSGSTGLIHAVGPICALAVGAAFYAERLALPRIVGLLLGFAVLVGGAKNARIEGEIWAFALLLGAMFCYGFSIYAIKKRLPGLPVMAFPCATFTVLAVPAALMFFASGGYQAMVHMHGTPAFNRVIFIVGLQAITALIAHVCYTQLIVRRGATFAVSVNYLVPVVALFWGGLDGESLTVLHFVSFMLVGVGLFLVNRPKKQL